MRKSPKKSPKKSQWQKTVKKHFDAAKKDGKKVNFAKTVKAAAAEYRRMK